MATLRLVLSSGGKFNPKNYAINRRTKFGTSDVILYSKIKNICDTRTKRNGMDQTSIVQRKETVNLYGDRAFALLKKHTEAGAKYRFGKLSDAESSRLAHEFSLILATHSAKVFLYWADVVTKIRQTTYPYIFGVQNCSLVSFCLGITEVNPLQADSYFERLLNRHSVQMPKLFAEVPNGKRDAIWSRLSDEEKAVTEIEENADRSDIPVMEAEAFFEKNSCNDRGILLRAAERFGFGWPKNPPETIGRLADFLVYMRYAEFMEKRPTILYQEDAAGLLVKAGLSYEEAECARRAFAKHERRKLKFYRRKMQWAARAVGDSAESVKDVFAEVEGRINYTVCRASYVAMAKYLYMETFFKEKAGREVYGDPKTHS